MIGVGNVMRDRTERGGCVLDVPCGCGTCIGSVWYLCRCKILHRRGCVWGMGYTCCARIGGLVFGVVYYHTLFCGGRGMEIMCE